MICAGLMKGIGMKIAMGKQDLLNGDREHRRKRNYANDLSLDLSKAAVSTVLSVEGQVSTIISLIVGVSHKD